MPRGRGRTTVRDVMHRFYKTKTLRSGTGRKGKKGRIVRSRKQAIAIGLSEAGLSRKGRRRGRRRR